MTIRRDEGFDGFEPLLSRRWRSAARRLGAACDRDEPRMRVDHQGSEVEAELSNPQFASSDPGGVLLTVSARPPLPALPRFAICPETIWERFTKAWLWAQDIELGRSARFDEIYVVKGKSRERIGAAWSDLAIKEAVRLYQRLFDGMTQPLLTIEAEPSSVTLRHDGHAADIDAHVIRAAIRVVGEIASADIHGLGALAALPGASRDSSADAPRFSVTVPAPATFAPQVARGAVKTRVILTRRTDKPDFLGRVGDASETSDEALAAFVGMGATLLGAVGVGTLRCAAGSLSFLWDGTETESERLTAAIRLLEACTLESPGDATGPYR